MAQSALEVSNSALIKLGEKTVTAVDGTDTTKAALLCYAKVDICKRAVLRMHAWNFAVKRKVLFPPTRYGIDDVTFVSSGLIMVTLDANVQPYSVGDYVNISGVSGATGVNGTWEIYSVSSGMAEIITEDGDVLVTEDGEPIITEGSEIVTITLIIPAVTTAGELGTYAASAYDFARLAPAFCWTYLFTLPSDCLRVLRINDCAQSDQWRAEGRYVLSDSDTLELEYIYDVTDYTVVDSLFYECLAVYLAIDLCNPLSQESGIKDRLKDDLREILSRARFVDATEDSLRRTRAVDWTGSRLRTWGGR